ncbi:hypothetical protein PBI_INDLOVU_52 [Mycobacterium phage Indlovu]|nr:hypothetical protein PBI_INDLOVU_52 [Mycobacterium phage Indlovu]
MSVNLDKTLLIQAAKDALAGHAEADRVYQADVAAYRARIAAEADKTPKLRALRDELSAVLKARRQPTEADARRFKDAAGTDYLSNLVAKEPSDYDVRNNVSRPAGWLSGAKVASYQGLIKMLEAHTEPTITANQLKLFGYTDLETLFRMAAQAGAIKPDAPRSRKR